MQSYLMGTICRIGIFIICAQVLVHFRPKASYEKYLKMLVSAMILLQLFIPVSGLFAGNKGQSLAERVAWFEAEMERSLENATADYSEKLMELEKEMENSLSGENAAGVVQSGAAQQPENDAVSAGTIEPVDEIRIHISAGGMGNAAISAGE